MNAMRGVKTSYSGMFGHLPVGIEPVLRVEIPNIQRDYAQGRDSADVNAIRRDFLDALVDAICGGEPVDLDFVYGEVKDGTLRPLDGQQRLTTLFLLHWYIGARSGLLQEAAPALQLKYATRATAELFCRELVDPANAPSEGFPERPSNWITDQSWYLHGWRYDPTVASMLVVIDAIHERLDKPEIDLVAAWNRLTDSQRPAISFYFLPIDDMPSGEDLYIKMNSRGKPLTPFENFKARFEKILNDALTPEQFDTIIHKIDGTWTDLLWRFHGGDHAIDDEFLRYLEFIIEASEWRNEESGHGTLLERAKRLYSRESANLSRHIEFFGEAFETWLGEPDLAAYFDTLFVGSNVHPDAVGDEQTSIDATNLNLLEGCLRNYGSRAGNRRVFTLTETLYLFAVLIHRQFDTEDIGARLRVIRNLIESADDEVREARMSELIAGVEKIVREGLHEKLAGFSIDRVQDELEKQSLIDDSRFAHALHRLEDHALLRGRVFAFELDPNSLPRRAAAFASLFSGETGPLLTGALLSKGTYGYKLAGDRALQLGPPTLHDVPRWRDVLANYGRGRNEHLRDSLSALLDEFSDSDVPPSEFLEQVMRDFVKQRSSDARFDWRYYLVTYPEMRSGTSGIYYGEHLKATGHWRYSMCMLNTGSLSGAARYRDPFLLTIRNLAGSDAGVDEPWFTGMESQPRWLRLSASGAGLRVVPEGYELEAPLDGELASLFEDVCRAHGADSGFELVVPQREIDGEMIDSEDRVVMGAALLRDLLDAGL